MPLEIPRGSLKPLPDKKLVLSGRSPLDVDCKILSRLFQSDELDCIRGLLVRSYRQFLSQFLTDFVLRAPNFIPARIRVNREDWFKTPFKPLLQVCIGWYTAHDKWSADHFCGGFRHDAIAGCRSFPQSASGTTR
jgi:hypothetical protein